MRQLRKEGSGFIIEEEGERVAEITYVPQGEGALVIDHTYVDPAYRGQTLGKDLVKRVVEYARESNRKIVPACSYAHAQFRRNKDYHDVWKQD